MSWFRFGLFDDFKWGPTVLLWGDDEGFRRLHATLRQIAAAKTPMSFADLSWATGVEGAQLQLGVVEPGAETLTSSQLPDGTVTVDWRVSSTQLDELTAKVDALASPGSGHHYFDGPPGTQLQVMMSKGEYPPDLR